VLVVDTFHKENTSGQK